MKNQLDCMVSPPSAADYAHADAAKAPVTPSAPLADAPYVSYDEPIKPQHAVVLIAEPLVAPELLPPTATGTRGFGKLTVLLIPFHMLNFCLATTAFCMVLTGVCLAVSLLPLCLLGVPIYWLLLQLVRYTAMLDVALANLISDPHKTAHWNVPDEAANETNREMMIVPEMRLAPKFTRVSARSTLVVLYFLTLKFALGIVSIVAVSLPLQPLAAQIVAWSTSESSDGSVVGWDVHTFNFATHPALYALTCVGYAVGGVLFMHICGHASRAVTHCVCCKTIHPGHTSRAAA